MWQFSRSRESVINPLQQMCCAGGVKAEQHAVVADSLGVRGSWHLAARSSNVDNAISRNLGRVGRCRRARLTGLPATPFQAAFLACPSPNCWVSCALLGGDIFAIISQSSDGICTARKWPSRVDTT